MRLTFQKVVLASLKSYNSAPHFLHVFWEYFCHVCFCNRRKLWGCWSLSLSRWIISAAARSVRLFSDLLFLRLTSSRPQLRASTVGWTYAHGCFSRSDRTNALTPESRLALVWRTLPTQKQRYREELRSKKWEFGFKDIAVFTTLMSPCNGFNYFYCIYPHLFLATAHLAHRNLPKLLQTEPLLNSF